MLGMNLDNTPRHTINTQTTRETRITGARPVGGPRVTLEDIHTHCTRKKPCNDKQRPRLGCKPPASVSYGTPFTRAYLTDHG